MKVWTYQEMKEKVLNDNDLQEETFISPNELAGYFNEALDECAGEIHDTNKDYFKTKFFLPWSTSQDTYALPENIYANKIRGIMFANGSEIYEIKRFRRRHEFEKMALADQFSNGDAYRYSLINPTPGQAFALVKPTPRETYVYNNGTTGSSFPVYMWLLRNVSRVPMVAFNGMAAEFWYPELINSTMVSSGADTLTTYAGQSTTPDAINKFLGSNMSPIAYVTGDSVKFKTLNGFAGTLPAPLVFGTTYYVIVIGAGVIKLATSSANATAGTAIDLTTTGSGLWGMKVGATTAIQNATLIDIPEHQNFIMQWVKCRSLGKEDPRLENELGTLVAMKSDMVNGLSNAVPDDDDEIQADFSHYSEMS